MAGKIYARKYQGKLGGKVRAHLDEQHAVGVRGLHSAAAAEAEGLADDTRHVKGCHGNSRYKGSCCVSMTLRAMGRRISLATSKDATELTTQGFRTRLDDVAVHARP